MTLSKHESSLARLRVARGLTQIQVAAEIGYSPSYYAMIEREPRLLSEAMAARLAPVLGVRASELFKSEVQR